VNKNREEEGRNVV